MTQDRYVTSKAIKAIGAELDADVIPEIKELRLILGSTDLGGLGWGAVGELLIGLRYRHVQETVEEKFVQAVAVLESWQEALDVVETNWRTAEDRSVVVYQ